ncbi:MAG: hypothetical protein LUG91_05105 [Ruminococcus sp.]|nr:hypothetical protein [Ruminococcus sp.]
MQFKKIIVGAILGLVFLILSILLREQDNRLVYFVLGLMACGATVLISIDREHQGIFMEFLSRYTMPIFLMHGFFAAPLRIFLLKIGITNAVIHITCGIAISIFGPVIAEWVMKKTKYLEFFIYPGKFIKIENSKQ